MKKSKEYNFPQILFPEMELTFADFFCGCGGFSLGFIMAGMKCVSAMDYDVDACHSYWANLCYKGWSHLWIDRNSPHIEKIKKTGMWNNGETYNWLFTTKIPDNWLSPDIHQSMPCLNLFLHSIVDLEPNDWLEMCKCRPGDISVFIGGPPCQGFSTANNRRSELDERNKLPLRFIHYAKVCKPKLVIMENVPGLLSFGRKKGEKEGIFVKWIKEHFDEAGYNLEYQIHNAADYGVPQERKRVIFYATRKDIKMSKLFPAKTHGKGMKPYITTCETIFDLPPVRSGEQFGYDSNYKEKSVLHPYGYNKIKGHVICPACLKYNIEVRNDCHNCGYDFIHGSINDGGVLVVPGIGYMAGIKEEIDNDYLRENYSMI